MSLTLCELTEARRTMTRHVRACLQCSGGFPCRVGRNLLREALLLERLVIAEAENERLRRALKTAGGARL